MKVKKGDGEVDFLIDVIDRDTLLLTGWGADDGHYRVWGRNITMKDAAAMINVMRGISERADFGKEQPLAFDHHIELEAVPCAWYELFDTGPDHYHNCLACFDVNDATILQLALERIVARSIVEGLK